MSYIHVPHSEALIHFFRQTLETPELPEVLYQEAVYLRLMPSSNGQTSLTYQPIGLYKKIKNKKKYSILESNLFPNDEKNLLRWYFVFLNPQQWRAENEWLGKDVQQLLLLPLTVLTTPYGWLAIPVKSKTNTLSLLWNYFVILSEGSSTFLINAVIEKFTPDFLIQNISSEKALVEEFAKTIGMWLMPHEIEIQDDEKAYFLENGTKGLTCDSPIVFQLELHNEYSITYHKANLHLPLPNKEEFNAIFNLHSYQTRQLALKQQLIQLFRNYHYTWKQHKNNLELTRQIKKILQKKEAHFDVMATMVKDYQKALKEVNQKLQAMETKTIKHENSFFFCKNSWVIYYKGDFVEYTGQKQDMPGLRLLWHLLCFPSQDSKDGFSALELDEVKTQYGLSNKRKGYSKEEIRIKLDEYKQELERHKRAMLKTATLDERIEVCRYIYNTTYNIAQLSPNRKNRNIYFNAKTQLETLIEEKIAVSEDIDTSFYVLRKDGKLSPSDDLPREASPTYTKLGGLIRKNVKGAFKNLKHPKFVKHLEDNIDFRSHTPFYYKNSDDLEWITDAPKD